MMTKNQINERDQLEILTIEQLVPQDHLVRKLDAAIDFSFIYPLVEDPNSTIGRPSIDPVVLIKMTFIQYTFGIRSMRQTIKENETNVAYRCLIMILKKYTESAKRRLSVSFSMPKKSMSCDGQP